jgi:hypothetical protein
MQGIKAYTTITKPGLRLQFQNCISGNEEALKGTIHKDKVCRRA